jgi:hypothetical protein
MKFLTGDNSCWHCCGRPLPHGHRPCRLAFFWHARPNAAGHSGIDFQNDAPGSLWKWSKAAYHFNRLDAGAVMCTLCPHRCRLFRGTAVCAAAG